MARKGKLHTIFDGATANSNGDSFDVAAYRHVVIQIATENSADATLKCLGSASGTEPTWASAAGVANIYAGKRMIDQDDNASVTGSTGIAFGGTDIISEFRVNTDNLRWLNFNISSYVAGDITVKAYGISDSRIIGV